MADDDEIGVVLGSRGRLINARICHLAQEITKYLLARGESQI